MGISDFFCKKKSKDKLTKSAKTSKSEVKVQRSRSSKTDQKQSDKNRSDKSLKPFGTITNIFEKINDTCVLLIHCPVHNKIVIDKSNEAIWLPFCSLTPNVSWYKAAIESFALILSGNNDRLYRRLRHTAHYDYMQMLDLFRFQMTETNKFITRVTYYFRLKETGVNSASPNQRVESSKTKKKVTNFTCCQNSDRLQWLDLTYICDGVIDNLWGPELVDLCRVIKTQKEEANPVYIQKLSEFGIEHVFELLPQEQSSIVNLNLEQSLLKKLDVTSKDIGRLFNDFLNQIYPSFYMTIDSYRAYLLFYQFDTEGSRIQRFFNASNYNNNGFLTFHEFLLGLVAMERGTPHNEFRIKFIFRYYDSRRKGILFEDDIRGMIKDMMNEANPGVRIDEGTLQKKVSEAMTKFEAKKTKDGLGIYYNNFLKVIGNLGFRGTSVLCRSKRNIISVVSCQMAARDMYKTGSNNLKDNLSLIIKDRSYKGVCNSCKSRKYQLSQYVTCLDSNSGVTIPKKEKIIIEKAFNALEYHSLMPVSPLDEQSLTIDELPSNILIAAIREFEQNKYALENQGVFHNDVPTLIRLIEVIYSRLQPILAKELRCRPVDGPAYIIGDIHGNIEDLLSLEKTIWRRFPFTNVSYVFLGDYVDRGKWSLECALYILSMKLLMPHTVTVLRGNHEVRDLQIKYTYFRECVQKYGEENGQKIFELTNKIFDRLPFSAIIDQSIYCAHGGIPHEITAIDKLNKAIPLEVVNPEIDCNVAWEIIWSDPIGPEEYAKIADFNDIKEQRESGVKEGYLRNNRRGTAFFYNELATSKFLNENYLTHIVRAHEVPKEGYVFHFDKKCTTIFSCSHYCGNDNNCAVILANNETLRIIRIDTLTNRPATD